MEAYKSERETAKIENLKFELSAFCIFNVQRRLTGLTWYDL
jgi:hypothetical protein